MTIAAGIDVGTAAVKAGMGADHVTRFAACVRKRRCHRKAAIPRLLRGNGSVIVDPEKW
jgi:hypothetical protein